jgi:outer membrane receptor protein involved in Fe transport
VSVDPCAPTLDANNNVVPATATFAQCQRTGVTAAQFGNGGTTDTIPQCVAGQCSIELGGNNALTPEKAKTFSIGFTATPSFLDGFAASVDYFKIDLTNVIVQGAPPGLSLSNCLATGDPTFCSKIVRNSLGGLNGATVTSGGFIDARFVNLASNSLSGVDFQGDYHADMSDLGLGANGSLTFPLVGTLTTTSKTITFPGQPAFDCSGLFGNTCGSPLSKWRHQFRVTWESL